MNRREFLNRVAIAIPVPRMWGDGVHDDTQAFKAALAGRPYYDVRAREFRWPPNPRGAKLIFPPDYVPED
jgi:hypothetical protein